MEQATSNIRRELAQCKASWEYAKYCDDAKGMRFILGYDSGLRRALEMLEGAEAVVDEEVEVWWNEREARKQAGTFQVTPWSITVWRGSEGHGRSPLFTIHRRMASYVNVLTVIVVFLSKHGIEIGLTERRD